MALLTGPFIVIALLTIHSVHAHKSHNHTYTIEVLMFDVLLEGYRGDTTDSGYRYIIPRIFPDIRLGYFSPFCGVWSFV
jgi:hypothetical protein